MRIRAALYPSNKCPKCQQPPGETCRTRNCIPTETHTDRIYGYPSKSHPKAASTATYGDLVANRPPAYVPPAGPDRCTDCGHHTATQGHVQNCPNDTRRQPNG